MTARAHVRRRRTQLGAVLAAVLVIGAVMAVAIGVNTLRSSRTGSAVERDQRVVVSFPDTPNVAIGVVDDQNRLASLVVATLSPDGIGGSFVVVPVNADTTLGFGATRKPLSRQPYVPGDAASAETLTAELEATLSLTIGSSLVLGPDELLPFVEPYAPLDVELPQTVVDADGPGSGVVSAEGERSLDAQRIVDVMTAIDAEGATHDHHEIDLAMWSALAEEIATDPIEVDVPLDEFDRPVPPASVDELLERLRAGRISVRTIALDRSTATSIDNPGSVDFVLLDRRDLVLVFAQVSPGRVSTPNQSLSFRIVARFSDEQMAAIDEDVTTVGIVRELIGELLFAQGNVVSVRTSASIEGVGEVTRLEVADEAFIEDVREVAPILFGEVEVVLATRVIDGVDVVAVLGTDFLDHRLELIAERRAAARAESEGDDDDQSDFDVGEPNESGDEAIDEADANSGTVAVDE